MSPPPDGYGRTWRITPTAREAALWKYCCAKSGEKLLVFMFRAIHDRCRQVVAERIARGKTVEQWVVEQLQDETPGGTWRPPPAFGPHPTVPRAEMPEENSGGLDTTVP